MCVATIFCCSSVHARWRGNSRLLGCPESGHAGEAATAAPVIRPAMRRPGTPAWPPARAAAQTRSACSGMPHAPWAAGSPAQHACNESTRTQTDEARLGPGFEQRVLVRRCWDEFEVLAKWPFANLEFLERSTRVTACSPLHFSSFVCKLAGVRGRLLWGVQRS